ncbi:MAG TPA: ABC transporter ATP-binding protein [Bacilli bacterium]
MIVIRGLSQAYGGNTVLDHVDLTVAKGEICALIGGNGAGKTTLFRSLLGLMPVRQGTVTLAGIPHRRREWKRHVSFLPEKFQLYPLLTGEENVRFFASCGRQTVDFAQIERVLRQTSLWDDKDKLARDFSKGMLQRLGLAVMLYEQTDIWILDEPTSGLDPNGREDILALIGGLRDKTVLFSTHDVSEVKRVCTHVAVLSGGKIAKSTAADFLRQQKGDRG